jgi:hypothetical protein
VRALRLGGADRGGYVLRMPPVTLAHKLGTTPHISPLLMKARRLGLPTGEHREALAVARGVRYYGGGSLPEAPFRGRNSAMKSWRWRS